MKTITLFTLLFLYIPNKKEVFICDSKNSEVYHLYENCEGLKKCKHEIKKITLERAKELNRRICGFEK